MIIEKAVTQFAYKTAGKEHANWLMTAERRESVEQKYCLVCEKPVKEGLRILASLLCSECEQELLKLAVSDPKYSLYVDKLKSVIASVCVQQQV